MYGAAHRGAVDLHPPGVSPVKIGPHEAQQPGQAEAVVPVGVRDEDLGDPRGPQAALLDLVSVTSQIQIPEREREREREREYVPGQCLRFKRDIFPPWVIVISMRSRRTATREEGRDRQRTDTERTRQSIVDSSTQRDRKGETEASSLV